MPPLNLERRVVHYRGHVQGVGFRYTTARIAERFAVTGIVENLPDGRVRVVVEGQPEEIDKFLAAVGEALGQYIKDVQSVTSPANNEFAAFRIRA